MRMIIAKGTPDEIRLDEIDGATTSYQVTTEGSEIILVVLVNGDGKFMRLNTRQSADLINRLQDAREKILARNN